LLTSSERVKAGGKWWYLSDVVSTVVYAHMRLADLFN
jgi:hypothetical protein